METITIYRAVGVTDDDKKFGWSRELGLAGFLSSIVPMPDTTPLVFHGGWNDSREAAERDLKAILEVHATCWAVRIEEAITTPERYAVYLANLNDQIEKLKQEAAKKMSDQLDEAAQSEETFKRLFGSEGS